MKTKQLLLYTCVLLLSSCIVKGDFKGLYGYYKQTNAESPGLLMKPAPAVPVCNVPAFFPDSVPRVIVTNGLRIGECLAASPDAIVYIWAPKCSSSKCYSLNAVQQKCDEKKMRLFIVAEYYDSKQMQLNYVPKNPTFGIDTRYYKTNRTSKYLSRFLRDLAPQKNINERLIQFKNGTFVKAFDELDSI